MGLFKGYATPPHPTIPSHAAFLVGLTQVAMVALLLRADIHQPGCSGLMDLRRQPEVEL
jgi:hypothetical protein